MCSSDLGRKACDSERPGPGRFDHEPGYILCREITGDEAWEFVKAAFSGHRGIATTHSESAEDAFGRLLTLSKGANIGESEKTIKEVLGRSIDVIFYIKEFRVVEVLEVLGYDGQTDRFVYKRLYPAEIGRAHV